MINYMIQKANKNQKKSLKELKKKLKKINKNSEFFKINFIS